MIIIIVRLNESLKCSAARDLCASKGQVGGWRETGVIDSFAEDVDTVGQSATDSVE